MKRLISVITGAALLFLFPGVVPGEENLKAAGSVFLSDLPEVKKHKLKNDISLLYIEEELPVTVIYASISFGKIYEDAGSAGITEVLNKTLTVAGSAAYPGSSIHQELESVGGYIRITSGWETIGIEIKVLSRYRNLAFKILGDILKNPVFDEKGVNSAKQLVLEKIIRDRDKPDEAGALKLREIIFGGSGYGVVPDEKSISSVNPDVLRKLWRRYASGSNLAVAVSSSASEESIRSLAESELSAIPKGERETYAADKDKISSGLRSLSGTIYLIPKELEQATIYMGTVAPEIKYEGNYALYIMNYILGGGSFNSRLMNDIRVKRGLAYSVYSLVRNRKNTGVFMSFVQTKNESVSQVLSLMNENITKMYSEDISREELDWAKESVKNSFVFRFNKAEDLLGNFLEIEYNDLDADYYKDYLQKINEVTSARIREESGKMFGQGIVTVVVGSPKLEKALSAHGKVIVCGENNFGQK